MRPTDPQTIIRYLLAWDAPHAAARRPYQYPERILRPPPPLTEWQQNERQEAERLAGLDPLREWARKHVAAWPDLVAIDSIIDEIPPTLADGHSRGTLATITSNVLKDAGCKPLGQFKEIRGRHSKGAYLWAIRDGEKFAAFSRENLLKWYHLQDPTTVERYRAPSQRDSFAALQWLREHPPKLPTLAHSETIAATIPPELGGSPGQRERMTARYLAEVGAVNMGLHYVAGRGRIQLWATRDIEKLAAMKPRERLEACYAEN
jgi:hypothetical protein